MAPQCAKHQKGHARLIPRDQASNRRASMPLEPQYQHSARPEAAFTTPTQNASQRWGQAAFSVPQDQKQEQAYGQPHLQHGQSQSLPFHPKQEIFGNQIHLSQPESCQVLGSPRIKREIAKLETPPPSPDLQLASRRPYLPTREQIRDLEHRMQRLRVSSAAIRFKREGTENESGRRRLNARISKNVERVRRYGAGSNAIQGESRRLGNSRADPIIVKDEDEDKLMLDAPVVREQQQQQQQPREEEDGPQTWLFLPDEINEHYQGGSQLDLYAYLDLKPDAPQEAILLAFKSFLQQHFLCLAQPHNPANPGSELIHFFRWILGELRPQETERYRVPYKKFIDVLNAYREEWADRTTKMKFSEWVDRRATREALVRGRYPKKLFEKILLAFLVLNDDQMRADYDSSQNGNGPKEDRILRFPPRQALEPSDQVKRSIRADNLPLYRGRRMMHAERVPNVGVWVTRENAARLETGREHVINMMKDNWKCDFGKVEYVWEYHKNDLFVVVQRRKRHYRVGWFADIEKKADLGLKKMIRLV